MNMMVFCLIYLKGGSMNHLEVETDELDEEGFPKVRQTISDMDELLDEEADIDVKSAKDKVDKLQDLEVGWHNGEGKAITDEAVKEAYSFIEDNYPLANMLHIYPTEEGGVLFEFYLGTYDCAYEIDQEGRARFYVV